MHGLPEGLEKGRVGGRIVKGLSWKIEKRNAAFGEEEPDLPFHPIQPFADPAPESPIFIGGGAHKRDLRIVLVEIAPAKLVCHGADGHEIHHDNTATGADIGYARPYDRAEAVLAGRKDAAYQEVAHFGRRHISYGSEEVRIGELFHRLAASAGGMEHQTFEARLQTPTNLLHARRGDPEH